MKNRRHHTPRGFRNNYVDSVTRSLRDVLRWRWDRFRNRLPPAPEVPTPMVAPDLAFIHRNGAAGIKMVQAVTWIGHATTLVQGSGLNVLTDPIFSHRASPLQFLGPQRAQAPGIAFEDLPSIDVVVISHNHYDHLDRHSILALARQKGGPPLFLVPLGIKAWLAKQKITRAVELDWWGAYEHAGVEFHFTPVQHWSARTLGDRNKTLWGGWAGIGGDFHWYFSGDTGYSADFTDTRRHFAARQTPQQGGGFDVALIAVGACEPRWFMQPQHVDPAEADAALADPQLAPIGRRGRRPESVTNLDRGGCDCAHPGATCRSHRKCRPKCPTSSNAAAAPDDRHRSRMHKDDRAAPYATATPHAPPREFVR
jgi:N-acyl-phosphatidylethanolamine-hydrolysing phospholipase D